MAAVVMDGKALAAKVKEEVRAQVERMERKPGLAVVLVGDNPASRVYVNGKKKDCGECGIYSEEYAIPAQKRTAESAASTARSTPSRPRPPSRSCWSWWTP